MKFLSVAAFLTVLAAPLTASATTFNHHWCFNWKAVNVDSNVGEDYGLSSTWVAKGARIGIQHSVAGNQPIMYTNVGTGCLDFQSTASSNFTVTMYAETKVGFAGNIVRAFASEANYLSWLNGPGSPAATLAQWVWLGVTPTCNGTTCSLTMTNTTGTDPVSNMIAVATHVLHKIDGETSPPISSSVELVVINETCGGTGGSGSCFWRGGSDPHIAWIQPTDDGDQRKFLIGHEVGHLLHDVRANFPAWGGSPWSITTGSHQARCDSAGIPGAHAMRSEEFSSGAFIEGFAHYMSAMAFNSHLSTDGAFKYYKDDTSTGGGVTYNFDLIDLEGSGATPAGGVSNWLHAAGGCGCSATNCAGRGVEMDWLRFLWDFRTDSGTKPTHAEIFSLTGDAEALHGLLSATDIQDWLEDVVPAALLIRWDTLADANGADPTPD